MSMFFCPAVASRRGKAKRAGAKLPGDYSSGWSRYLPRSGFGIITLHCLYICIAIRHRGHIYGYRLESRICVQAARASKIGILARVDAW